MLGANLFDIWSDDFQINNHSFTIRNQAHKLKIKSEFEILGNFNLPEKTIYINYSFPNQISKNNFLSFNKKKKCKAEHSNDLNCYVFENSVEINQSSDHFFNKEIIEEIKVPFEVQFNFSIKQIIGHENFQINTKHSGKQYYDFIKKINNTSIQNDFNFANTFVLKKQPHNQSNQKLNLVKEIKIEKNKSNSYFYDELIVKFADYSNITNEKIHNWFEISFTQPFTFECSKQYIYLKTNNFSKNINLQNTNNFKKTSNNKYQFFTKQNIYFNKQSQTWEVNDLFKNGLFFEEEAQGFLNANLLINIYNNSSLVKLSNFFEFKNYKKENKKLFVFKKDSKEYFSNKYKYESINF